MNILTEEENEWLEHTLYMAFQNCKDWERGKMKAYISIAEKLGFKATAEEMKKDYESEFTNQPDLT